MAYYRNPHIPPPHVRIVIPVLDLQPFCFLIHHDENGEVTSSKAKWGFGWTGDRKISRADAQQLNPDLFQHAMNLREHYRRYGRPSRMTYAQYRWLWRNGLG